MKVCSLLPQLDSPASSSTVSFVWSCRRDVFLGGATHGIFLLPHTPWPPGTGTEAIESAVKLARHETGKQNIIYFKGSFHGRSLTTLAMTTSKAVYRVGYGPLPAGMHQAQFPYCARCSTPRSEGASCCGAAIESVRQLLKETTSASETAAVLIEPILGEGGYVVPPPGFFKELRQLCDENGMLLIADEVQSVSCLKL